MNLLKPGVEDPHSTGRGRGSMLSRFGMEGCLKALIFENSNITLSRFHAFRAQDPKDAAETI